MENNNGMKKILIVEDDPFISDIYVVELESNGFDVEVATNGEEALEMIENQKFDMMLLDIIMPHKDGFAVLNEVRSNARHKMAIIILSNLAGKEHIKKALNLGADDYIIKTQFTPKEVLEKIKEIFKDMK